MSATFDAVAEIISENTDVSKDDIKPESHLMRDLGIDSLAFLDLAFEIDQRFSIQMPVEDWMQSVNQGDVQSDEFFIVGNLCRHIDSLVSANVAA
ncbi:MAG TPA: acyl carrier protein [Hyphomicrobiaceae bacterium]|nr:acyl carrier protein [Hyphomicrobiaceae bacterium]